MVGWNYQTMAWVGLGRTPYDETTCMTFSRRLPDRGSDYDVAPSTFLISTTTNVVVQMRTTYGFIKD